MGFTPGRTPLKITFDEGTPLHGFEFKATACTIGEWNEMLRRSEADNDLQGVAAAAANDEFAQFFLDHVKSWNLELEEGQPDPITLDAWHKLDHGWGGLIIGAWQFAMVSIPRNSPKPSSDGGTSAERQLELESLSESLPSWNEPS